MSDITAEIYTPTIQAELYRATLPGATIENGESPVIVRATVNRDKGTFELVNCAFCLLKEMYDNGYTIFLVADTMFDDCPIKTCAKIVYVDDETFQFSQIIADTERGVSTSYTFLVNSEGKNDYIETDVTIKTDSDDSSGQTIEIGSGLKLEDNVLSVDTAENVEKDNTKPVTSATVYTVVGNINAILESL